MRKGTAQVMIGAFFAAMIVACASEPEPNHAEICVDEQTQQRVDDEECDESSSHFKPHRSRRYYSSGSSVPAVGSRVTGGTTVRPATGTIGTAPKSGGFGGFTGSAGT